MTAQAPLWPDNSASVLRQALAHRIDALDGYPVAALIDTWADHADGVDPVLQHVLAQWIARLDDDLALIPADAGPALVDIRRRMIATRGAMAQLLALVRPPDENRLPRPGAGWPQLSAQALAGDAGVAQLH